MSGNTSLASVDMEDEEKMLHINLNETINLQILFGKKLQKDVSHCRCITIFNKFF